MKLFLICKLKLFFCFLNECHLSFFSNKCLLQAMLIFFFLRICGGPRNMQQARLWTRLIFQHDCVLTRPCEMGKACLKSSSKMSLRLWPSCFRANLKFRMSCQKETIKNGEKTNVGPKVNIAQRQGPCT